MYIQTRHHISTRTISIIFFFESSTILIYSSQLMRPSLSPPPLWSSPALICNHSIDLSIAGMYIQSRQQIYTRTIWSNSLSSISAPRLCIAIFISLLETKPFPSASIVLNNQVSQRDLSIAGMYETAIRERSINHRHVYTISPYLNIEIASCFASSSSDFSLSV